MKWNTDICYSMNESSLCYMKETAKTPQVSQFHFYKCPEQSVLQETESWLADA